MEQGFRTNKHKVTCPICGEKFGKPYSHFMRHVANGEMEQQEEVIKITRVSFNPVESGFTLPCGHTSGIVSTREDWICKECGKSVRE